MVRSMGLPIMATDFSEIDRSAAHREFYMSKMNNVDLGEIKQHTRVWLEQVRVEKLKFKMSRNAYDDYLLDSTSLGYDLMQMISVPLSEKEKNEAKKILDNYQSFEGGLFVEEDYRERLDVKKVDRIAEMHANYLAFQCIGAYKAINRMPKNKISFYDKFIEGKGIKHYLSNNCPWHKSPWGAGGMVDNLGTILDCNIRMGYSEYQSVLEDIFEWLDENQSKENGLWGESESQGVNGLINGAYHLMRGTYFLQDRNFNYGRKIIDALIQDIKENNIFSSTEAHGCQDLDHFYLLEKCVEKIPDYKRGEIESVCGRRFNEIMNLVYCSDGGFSFEARNSVMVHNYYQVTPGVKESDIQGTVFYLQAIVSIMNIIGVQHKIRSSVSHG